MKTKGILGMALAFALFSVMVVSASAAEVADGSYGYLAGQQKKGIGGGAHSDAQHLDADALVAAGIIDQATADSIRQYAANKHTQLSGRYGSMGNMTPTERHAYYAGFDRSRGDSVDALLAAGIITQ